MSGKAPIGAAAGAGPFPAARSVAIIRRQTGKTFSCRDFLTDRFPLAHETPALGDGDRQRGCDD